MNLNNVVAMDPSPILVGLISTGAVVALLKVKNEKPLSEKEIANLHQAEELLKIVANLSFVREGKVHELGTGSGVPLGFLWLREPVEEVTRQLHAAETPVDHGSRFLEHLSVKLATVVGQAERGIRVRNGETELLERFFAGLSNKMHVMAIRARVREGENDGD